MNVVVLSGGLDSTVCMALAANGRGGVGPPPGGGARPAGGSWGPGRESQQSPVLALTFDYGQRHRIELERAAAVAAFYGAEQLVVNLDASQWGGSALTDDRIAIPEEGGEGIPVTYVPARNLIFLSVAMGVCEARDADAAYVGVNALDYSGYPDCRPEFIESFAATASLALRRGVEGRPVEVRTPLIDLSKAQIVQLGVELKAPLHLTWSCYRGGPVPCGACDSCHLRAKGFAEAGVTDPALER